MENTQVKENPFLAMMDEEAVKRSMQMPSQAMDILFDASRKMQEASLDYFRQVEKIQRDYWQGMAKVMNVTLPGESNLWEMQTKMVENGFDMLDRMMSVGKKA